MPPYIHQISDWPKFTWDQQSLMIPLGKVRHLQGLFLGQMLSLGLPLGQQAQLTSLTHEVMKTSEIEGETLNTNQVRSSIARRMGIAIENFIASPRHVNGIVDVVLDATQRFNEPLTKERLCGWHAQLFPTGFSGDKKITVGEYRPASADPMQVISGALGREQVHYEAPGGAQIPKEMNFFLNWFSAEPQHDLVLNSAMAHLWFVNIHPFEDGNGRLARAIADMMLSQSQNSPQRFYSMSRQILKEQKAYYAILEKTGKGGLDISEWMHWYLGCLERAVEGAQEVLKTITTKARFWDQHAQDSLNTRQRDMLNRLLDGFEGKLTSSKWAKMAKCSQDTALRDMNNLVDRGILALSEAGGRSTSYELLIVLSKSRTKSVTVAGSKTSIP